MVVRFRGVVRSVVAPVLAGTLLLTSCAAHHGKPKERPETGPLTLSSPAFKPSGEIPINYSCAGADTSPPITWHGAAPAGTSGWAIVMTDADVRPAPWVQWVVSGIPLSTRSLPAGVVPTHATVSRASNGTRGFVGACPPSGKTHHYVFTVFAVGKALSVSPGTNATQTLHAIAAASLGRATLTARFAR